MKLPTTPQVHAPGNAYVSLGSASKLSNFSKRFGILKPSHGCKLSPEGKQISDFSQTIQQKTAEISHLSGIHASIPPHPLLPRHSPSIRGAMAKNQKVTATADHVFPGDGKRGPRRRGGSTGCEKLEEKNQIEKKNGV